MRSEVYPCQSYSKFIQ